MKIVWNTSLDSCFYNFFFFNFQRQLNLLSTATPAVGAWLVPIDQLKSSLNKLETEGTLRICAVMGCIMTEALEVCLSTVQGIRYSLLDNMISNYSSLLENNRPASSWLLDVFYLQYLWYITLYLLFLLCFRIKVYIFP